MTSSSLMSSREVSPGPEAVEAYADYAARVILFADEYTKEILKLDTNPRLKELKITSLKLTPDKDCLDRTDGQVSSVNFYELGPSSRSVRGIECMFPIDADGVQKSARYEWDYLEPTAEARQRTIIAFKDTTTREIVGSSFTTGFTEEDLRTIEIGIKGYAENSDAKA
jgi:hypothetical protein